MQPGGDARKAAERAFHEYLELRSSGEAPSSVDDFVAARPPEVQGELRQLLDDYHKLVVQGEPDRTGAPRALGEFRLVRKLGEGASGVVWEAEQRPLKRRVALKILRPHFLLSDHARERFDREAIAGGRLQHPHIVAIFGAGCVDETQYIVQELIPSGRSLEHWIDEQNPRHAPSATELRRVVGWFADLAGAARCMHEAGVIHRDIKPSNILLDGTSRALLADFGLAELHDESSRSVSGEFVGTPYYASPEQVLGQRRNIDARSDVFSLGATLYEALGLHRPFPGQGRSEVVEAILLRDPVDLRVLRPGLPGDLCAVVHKSLHKNRADRYQDMAEFERDLRSCLAGAPVRARPLGPLRRAWRWCGRRPVISASVGAALSVALLFVALLLWMDHRAEERERDAEARAMRADALRRLERAGAELAYGRVLTAREYLEGVAPPWRGWEWRHLMFSTDSSRSRHTIDGLRSPLDLALDPGRRWWATATRDRVVRVRGEESRPVGEPGRGAQVLATSPSGHRFAGLDSDGVLQVWTIGEPVVIRVETGVPGRPRALCFLDEARLALAAGSSLRVLSAEDGGPLAQRPVAGGVACVDVERDSGRVAVGCWDGGLFLGHRDLASFEVIGRCEQPVRELRLLDGNQCLATLEEGGAVRIWGLTGEGDGQTLLESGAVSLDGSPGGGLLAVAGDDGALRLWNPRTFEMDSELRGHSEALGVVRFERGRSRVWTASVDGVFREWDGAGPRRTTPGPHGRGGCWFDAGGERVLTSVDRMLRSRDARTGRLLRPFWGGEGRLAGAAFSPDGRRVVTLTDRGRLDWWDADHGRRTASLATAAGPGKVWIDDRGETVVLDVRRILRWYRDGREIAQRQEVGAVALGPASGDWWWAAGDSVFRGGASGSPAPRFRAPAPVSALAVHPDRDAALIGTVDGRLGCWEAGADAPRMIERSPWRTPVRSVAFHPDGDRILGHAPDERSAVLFELEQLEPVWRQLVPHHVETLRFDRDGAALLADSVDWCAPLRWVGTDDPVPEDWLRLLDRRGRAEQRAEDLAARFGLKGPALAAAEDEAPPGDRPLVEESLERLGNHPIRLREMAWQALRGAAPEAASPQRTLGWSERAFEAAPDLPGVAVVHAEALLRSGRPARALEVLEGAPEPGPSDPPGPATRQALRILILAACGRREEALRLRAEGVGEGPLEPDLEAELQAMDETGT